MKIKKWHYKALAALLGASVCVGSFAACDTETAEVIPVSLPDYADDREIDLLGYVNPTNGDYTHDSIPKNIGIDFRTVEHFKTYKDAGFNIAFARYDSSLPADVTAETWPQSGTKILCDKAYEAGLRKILITDNYLDGLISYSAGALIGSGATARYPSQEAMDADVLARLSIYKDTPGFYGVILRDEPAYEYFENYALVHKSLKRVMPEIYIYNNLPYCFNHFVDIDEEQWKAEHDGQAPTYYDTYSKYLCDFLEMTEAENLSIDVYPFRDQPQERRNIFWNAQVLREACDKYGADFSFTLQSICYTAGETLSCRVVTKNDLWLEMNTMLGYGAKSLQYYTYFPYPSMAADHSNIGNFMDRYGNKTSVYYDAQKVMTDVRKFDHILLNYDFQGAKIHLAESVNTGLIKNYLGSEGQAFDNSWEHTLLTKVTQDNDALLVTEMKDSANDLYMYMIMNAIDVLYSKDGRMEYTECTFTAEFPGYDYVAEFNCGDLTYVKLDNGKYTKTLSSGYAVYLVPLKVA